MLYLIVKGRLLNGNFDIFSISLLPIHIKFISVTLNTCSAGTACLEDVDRDIELKQSVMEIRCDAVLLPSNIFRNGLSLYQLGTPVSLDVSDEEGVSSVSYRSDQALVECSTLCPFLEDAF